MAIEVINKIIIFEDAVLDYEETLGFGRFNRRIVKAEVEDYIDLLNKDGRLLYTNYFRCKYLDEESGHMLMLFIYRADKNWSLAGVCSAEDWSDEAEDSGAIRECLKSTITDLGKGDWVLTMRLKKRQELKMLAKADKESYGEDYTAMVKDLLKNYKLHKAKIAVMPKDDPDTIGLADKLEFLELCIIQLDEDEQAIIRDLYFNNRSLKRVGKKRGYAKTSVFRIKEKAISMLEMLFAERYNS